MRAWLSVDRRERHRELDRDGALEMAEQRPARGVGADREPERLLTRSLQVPAGKHEASVLWLGALGLGQCAARGRLDRLDPAATRNLELEGNGSVRMPGEARDGELVGSDDDLEVNRRRALLAVGADRGDVERVSSQRGRVDGVRRRALGQARAELAL